MPDVSKIIVTMRSLLVFTLYLTIVRATPFEKPIHRIVGGHIAQLKQLPYYAKLKFTIWKEGQVTNMLCGGALISKRTILTAAHCLQDASSVMIYLGVTKAHIGGPTQVLRATWRSTGGFITHENYNDISLQNDIALLTFTSPIVFNDAVSPVNLPMHDQENLVNRTAIIAGFGKTGTNKKESDDLLFAKRKILPESNCVDAYPWDYKTNMHICIDGSEMISTCPGDSGGPLVVQELDGSRTVVGVTSFGGEECDVGLPLAFTNVKAYLDWIKKNMK